MTAKLPVYVINLERSADRRKFMEAHLSEFPEMDCKFIPAVDGKMLRPEELPNYYDDRKANAFFGRSLVTGEIGCAVSHIACYRKMLDEKHQSVLVLEDDAMISTLLPQIIPSLYEWLNSESPRVILLTPCRRYWKWPSLPLSTCYRLYKPCGSTSSAAAYLINQAAASVLVKKLLPVHTVADHWQYFRRDVGLDVRVVAPHCVSFRPCSRSGSTIGASRHNGHSEKKWIRRLKNLWFRPLEHLGLISFGRQSW